MHAFFKRKKITDSFWRSAASFATRSAEGSPDPATRCRYRRCRSLQKLARIGAPRQAHAARWSKATRASSAAVPVAAAAARYRHEPWRQETLSFADGCSRTWVQSARRTTLLQPPARSRVPLSKHSSRRRKLRRWSAACMVAAHTGRAQRQERGAPKQQRPTGNHKHNRPRCSPRRLQRQQQRAVRAALTSCVSALASLVHVSTSTPGSLSIRT